MSPTSPIPRRTFLQQSAGATAGLTVLSSAAAGVRSANERINIGVIGLGSRGLNLVDAFLQEPDCRITAICDVDRLHYRDRVWGKGQAYGREPIRDHINRAYANAKANRPAVGLQVFADYRELLGSDVDAVVVATPDHWHAHCTIDAIRAGKDVYCEKPVTHLFAEGQQVVREVERQNAVFQTGSQQRSDPLFQRVVEIARNGLLGELQSVEVGLPPGYAKPQGSTKVIQPRESLDYDFWCGPSPVLPLMQARFHRWWRGHRAYGGGVLMDWIGHHNDIAQWAIGMHESGPQTVEAVDWTFPETDIYNTPFQYEIRCTYSNGVRSTISSRNTQGLKVTGSDGWVYARRGKIEASNGAWLKPGFQPGPYRTEKPKNHAADFLQKIGSREACIAPAHVAHRSITPGHLGYVSQALGRALQWDPEKETVIDDAEANRLLQSANYRSGWDLTASAAAE